jgi:formylglycine-generating enzyme required for sulfatase activity
MSFGMGKEGFPAISMSQHAGSKYCEWLSARTGHFYRLPTEAEWEYAARGGQQKPYWNFPWANEADATKANWPESKNPFRAGPLPWTTPVGFFNGQTHRKADFGWPGSPESFQTANGANGFGLYDMAGNVWQLINDWYGQSYYSLSPYDNPKGPDTGFIMPDGLPYRGMRGGNWYNGPSTGVNDGHSRVSNRNPSYYRGPQDPNHPWYHVGFRTARNDDGALPGAPLASLFAAAFGADHQRLFPGGSRE